MSYQPERWSLNDLLPTPGTPELEQFLAELETQIQAFEALRPTLTPDMSEAAFLEVLQRYEQLIATAVRLNAYAYLWFSEDTHSQTALAFRAKIQQLVAELENRTLFFTLWWKELDDAAATRLMANTGDLHYFLAVLRLFKPHTLTEAEERVINIKNVNGIQSVLTLYDMITTRFVYKLTIEGEVKELTRGQLSVYVYSPDPEQRAAAYQELYRLYSAQADVLAEMYAARVRDWTEENVKLRAFAGPISVRNLENDVPDAAVETLLEVIRRNAPLFQRYFRLKARALGLERLRRYDIYAPFSDTDKQYSFDEAVRMVDAAYRSFSPTLADLAQRVLQEHHLDAEVRPAKMDGAYCYSPVPVVTPWVLVNYTNTIRDVSTLAHELGHAVHALMAHEHSPLTFHSSLPMAETASVFGEMLLNDKLLREEQEPQVRRTILGGILDDTYATVTRQAYFVLFEKTAHEMILKGATPDELYVAYMENLREQFGDAVELSDEFRYEWVSVPHIYQTPFYCYAYAFGNLLVLALYRKYKELGRVFEPDYLRILAHGGSASPAAIIGEAGFDMTSAEFWQGGFDLLAEMVDELEALI